MKPPSRRRTLAYHLGAVVTAIRLDLSGWLLTAEDGCRAWWKRVVADDEPLWAAEWREMQARARAGRVHVAPMGVYVEADSDAEAAELLASL